MGTEDFLYEHSLALAEAFYPECVFWEEMGVAPFGTLTLATQKTPLRVFY